MNTRCAENNYFSKNMCVGYTICPVHYFLGQGYLKISTKLARFKIYL